MNHYLFQLWYITQAIHDVTGVHLFGDSDVITRLVHVRRDVYRYLMAFWSIVRYEILHVKILSKVEDVIESCYALVQYSLSEVHVHC